MLVRTMWISQERLKSCSDNHYIVWIHFEQTNNIHKLIVELKESIHMIESVLTCIKITHVLSIINLIIPSFGIYKR